jgi:glutaconate CoA-transferase subunit B
MSDIRATEIMVAAGANELKDGEIVVVGIGLPQIACFLAKATHAPSLTRFSKSASPTCVPSTRRSA